MQRLDAAAGKRLPIEIHFEKHFGGALPCLPVNNADETAEYATYLAVVPGKVLADIYQKYGSQLLEQNVRAFLQFTGKINKGIRETILKEPQMFLAFNNGIAATAEYVELVQTRGGGKAISFIRDLQIVNGGQTTASLFHVLKKDKKDLSEVFVQMKLSVVRNKTRFDSIVSSIARYANTQNKVVEADFTANNPWHIEVEKLSRTIYAPVQVGQPIQTRWFYERVRGQYKTELSRELTQSKKKSFPLQNPRNQWLTKEELAKYYNTWENKPWLVARGSQKSYVEFMRATKNIKTNNIFFEDLVAKAILFKAAERLYGTRPNAIGEIRYLTVPYALAWLNEKTQNTEGGIDLFKIWKNQGLSESLDKKLFEILRHVDRFLRDQAPNKIFTDWTKKEECWQTLINHNFAIDLTELQQDLATSTATKNRYLRLSDEIQALERQNQEKRFREIPETIWFQIQSYSHLTLNQKNSISFIRAKIQQKKPFSDIELKNGLDIIEEMLTVNPAIFDNIEIIKEEKILAQSQNEKVADDSESIKKLYVWERQNKRLKDGEFRFLKQVTQSDKPLSEKQRQWLVAIIAKAKTKGFR